MNKKEIPWFSPIPKRVSVLLNRSCAILGTLIYSSVLGFAQLNTNSAVTPQQLVQSIVGAGYSVSNAKLNCPAGAVGTFTNVTSNIGLTNGILLTTGAVSIANGPNNSPNAGVNNGAPGDFDLSNLAGAATYDGCALEFDLIPACDTLKINYVFGSEEYPEYVNKQFNDVFAFFISGPGFVGLQNIALVPGTALPVSINNINAGKNAQYYIDNTGGASIQYDGFTTPLQAKAKVTPCETYHLKLVIADVLDGIFDSGVFIQGNSIECQQVAYNDIASNTNAVKSCSNGSFSFCRTGDTTKAFTVNYTVGGTAVSGVDYVPLSGSTVIPAGQRCMTTNLITKPNGNGGGVRTVKIMYQYGFCPKTDTITLTITDPAPIDAGPDVFFCSGDTAKMGNVPTPQSTYSWTPTTGLSNPNIANPKVTLVNNGTSNIVVNYVLSATNPAVGACVLKDSLLVTVRPTPNPLFTAPSNFCVGANAAFTDNSSGAAGSTITGWHWDFGNNLFDNIKNPTIKYTSPGTYTVTLTATDNHGCKNDTALVVHAWPLPIASFNITSACQGDSVRFANTSSVPGGGTILQSIWNFGDGSPLISSANPIHVYPVTSNSYTVQVIVTSSNNCLSTTQQVATINPKPKALFTMSPASVCPYDAVKFANQSTGANNAWTFGDGTNASIRNPFHHYPAPGTYTVELVTSSNFGCKDTTQQTVTIHKLPTFDFNASDTAGCPSFCTTFTCQPTTGSDPIAAWSWTFNPGDIASGTNATYCYKKDGHYSPLLVATSSFGCVDTLTKPFYIHVYPRPKAAFTLNPNTISIFQPTTTITNTSSPDVNSWSWSFGDTKTDTTGGPLVHKYTINSDQYNKKQLRLRGYNLPPNWRVG
jgi:PKD repeat protein